MVKSSQVLDSKQSNSRQPNKLWRWGAAACLFLQLPMAAYFMLVHQR